MKTFAWFTYYPFPDFDRDQPRPTKVFKTRDGSAFIELQSCLVANSMRYVGQILNRPWLPDRKGALPPPSPTDTLNSWSDMLGRCNLLVLTIRPPIDDARQACVPSRPSLIPCSYTALEDRIRHRLKEFFDGYERSSLSINSDWRSGGESRNISFFVQGREYSWMRDSEGEQTLGIVAYYPQSEGLPALLNVFGMGGNDTLQICTYLSLREPQFLKDILSARMPRLALFNMTRETCATDIPRWTEQLLDGWIISPRFYRERTAPRGE